MWRVLSYTSNNIARLESKLCLLLVLFYFFFIFFTFNRGMLGASLCMLVCKVLVYAIFIYAFRLVWVFLFPFFFLLQFFYFISYVEVVLGLRDICNAIKPYFRASYVSFLKQPVYIGGEESVSKNYDGETLNDPRAQVRCIFDVCVAYEFCTLRIMMVRFLLKKMSSKQRSVGQRQIVKSAVLQFKLIEKQNLIAKV